MQQETWSDVIWSFQRVRKTINQPLVRIIIIIADGFVLMDNETPLLSVSSLSNCLLMTATFSTSSMISP